MSPNVLAPQNLAMDGSMGAEAAMPAGSTLRERASDLADRFRGMTQSAFRAKSAFRNKAVSLANDTIKGIENRHLRRAATVVAALGIMAITEPGSLKAGASWAADIEVGDVDLSPSDGGMAESDTAALQSDHSSVATGHFVEGDVTNGAGSDQAESDTVSHPQDAFTTNNKVWGNGDIEGNEGDSGTGTGTDQVESDTTSSATTTTTGESAIDAQDDANSAAAAGTALAGGYTADNEGLATGTAQTGEATGETGGYEADLGEFNKKTGDGTIEGHLENAAEARGLHLSESDKHIADQRYLDTHEINGHQMTWDDARHLSNGYHISLSKDDLDKIFEGLGDQDDSDTDVSAEDDDTDFDTSANTDTDDKKAVEEEHETENDNRPWGSGLLEGNDQIDSGDGTDPAESHTASSAAVATPVATASATPSPSTSASPSPAAIAAASNAPTPPLTESELMSDEEKRTIGILGAATAVTIGGAAALALAQKKGKLTIQKPKFKFTSPLPKKKKLPVPTPPPTNP